MAEAFALNPLSTGQPMLRQTASTLRDLTVTLFFMFGWLALVFFVFSGLVMAQSPRHAIVYKDGTIAGEQFADAVKVNIRPELRTELSRYVAAIRYAENGGKGRQYGILHKRVKPTYRSQAGWCAATVQKNYDRWV